MTEPHGAVAEHAEHSPYLRHHFDNMEQQFDSATLGMWVFLLTEIMFFGGMFGAYTVYRSMYPEAFASTSMHMNPGGMAERCPKGQAGTHARTQQIRNVEFSGRSLSRN